MKDVSPKKIKRRNGTAVGRKKNAISLSTLRKEIDKIPGLIHEHIPRSVLPKRAPIPPYQTSHRLGNRTALHNKKVFLAIGVTSLLSIIVVMWIWNLKMLFYRYESQQVALPPVVGEARRDIGSLLKEITDNHSINTLEQVAREQQISTLLAATLATVSSTKTQTNSTTTAQ